MDGSVIPGSPVSNGLWKQVRKSPHPWVLKRHRRVCAERRKRQQQDEHCVHNKQFPQCYQQSYWEELWWALPHMLRTKHWKKRKYLSFKKEFSHLLRKKNLFFHFIPASPSLNTPWKQCQLSKVLMKDRKNPSWIFNFFSPSCPRSSPVPCPPAESLWSQSALPQQLS